MRLTLSHHHAFSDADRMLLKGALAGPEAWDRLRLEGSKGFRLAKEREAMTNAARSPQLLKRAQEIDALLKREGATTAASYGVGTGLLEANLQLCDPSRALALTEFAPGTVERLREMFPKQTVAEHDLRRDQPLAADVHIFHRLDTELDNTAWRAVFDRFHKETVLVIATQVIGLRTIVAELHRRLPPKRATRAGWIRTLDAFEALWEHTHSHERLSIGDLPAWLLHSSRPV